MTVMSAARSLLSLQSEHHVVSLYLDLDPERFATPPARAEMSYEHPETTPGTYEIVLQLWKYVNYRKKPEGEFIDSQFVVISNKVSYKI